MKTKLKSFEDIPQMVEQLLTIQQREIDRLQALIECSNQDIKTSITLLQCLNQAYLQYRVLKEEIKRETKTFTQDKIREQILQLANKN